MSRERWAHRVPAGGTERGGGSVGRWQPPLPWRLRAPPTPPPLRQRQWELARARGGGERGKGCPPHQGKTSPTLVTPDAAAAAVAAAGSGGRRRCGKRPWPGTAVQPANGVNGGRPPHVTAKTPRRRRAPAAASPRCPGTPIDTHDPDRRGWRWPPARSGGPPRPASGGAGRLPETATRHPPANAGPLPVEAGRLPAAPPPPPPPTPALTQRPGQPRRANGVGGRRRRATLTSRPPGRTGGRRSG